MASVLLSAELKQNNGFVSEERLKSFSVIAQNIIAKEDSERTAQQEIFLADYVLHVAQAKIEDHNLTKQVEQRAAGITLPPLMGPTGFPLGPAQNIRISELALKAEVFDGKAIEARSWVDAFERMAKANNWTEATMIKYLPSFLSKSSSEWFVTMCQPFLSPNDTWQLVRQQFIKHYLGDQDYLIHRRRLNNLFQHSNESISAFLPKTLSLINMSYPEGKISNEEKIELVIEKLLPVYQEKLALCKPTNLFDLNDLCLKIEQSLRSSKTAARRLDKTESISKPKQFPQRTVPKGYQEIKTNKPLLKCNRCERSGHLADKCFSSSKVDGTKLDPKSAAPKPLKKKNVTSIDAKASNSDNKLTTTENTPKPIVEIRRVSNLYSDKDNLLSYKIKINGKDHLAMLDSGAQISVIKEDVVSENNWRIVDSKTAIFGADNNRIGNLGKVNLTVEMKVGEILKKTVVDLYVVRNLSANVIIGMDILNLFKIGLNLGTKTICFEDFPEIAGVSKNSNECHIETIHNPIENSGSKILNKSTASSSERTILPARSLSILNIETNIRGLVLTSPHQISPTLVGASSVSSVELNPAKMMVANLDTYPVVIPEGTIMGSCESVNETGTIKVLNNVRSLANTNECVNVGDNLTENQLIELDSLLSKFRAAFSVNGEIGLTNVLSHKIELLPEATAFKEPRRRRPLPHVDEARRQIKKMLEDDIVEESNSPFASAYLLVKKKDGTMRMCIDFRRLNSITKKVSFPLPNIEECLDNLAGKSYFSTLDLSSGFWQIPIEQESRELTAFQTEDNQYQFKRMPFGLCNAPATFQKLVNILFSGLKGLEMQVFIDDICIATHNWEDHMKQLGQVFKILIQANLTLKPSKCTFGASEVIFLGHVLSANGIRQDPEKLKAILELPKPKNVEELRRILGMVGYYRRFVPEFASLSAPLFQLTHKNVAFIWEEIHNENLSRLLKALENNATLKYFRYDHPTVLKTDASKTGVGGILQQKDDNGEWRIVVCCSRKLNNAEKNYGVTELEALAIVHCLTKLRPYLLGHQFTILTDHCALCALNMKEPKNERLKRWSTIIRSFDFIIKYIKGGLHRDVDCISRAPVSEAPDGYLDEFPVSANNIKKVALLATPCNLNDWLKALDEDDEAPSLFTLAENNRNQLSQKNNLLYKDNMLYVPSSLRQDVIKENHDNADAAHGGIAATLSRLEARYWWPTMRAETTDFVNRCDTCLKRKAERQLPAGNMYHHNVISPLQMVAFDCLGPNTESLDGKRHVILAVDMFTRFIDAKAVKSVDSNTFSRFLLAYVGRFGVPTAILTDNAPTFINQQVRSLVNSLHIQHFRSTPHHSQGNSIAERTLQSLQEKIALLTANNPLNEWAKALPMAILSLNTTPHKSVGFPPFVLMFGRRPPIVSNISRKQTNIYDLQAELVQKTLDETRAETIARQSDAQAASRQYFEANHLKRSFEIGELVLAKHMGRRAKFALRFQGPFKIISKEKDIYEIESVENQTRLRRHLKDLKAYPYESSGMSRTATIALLLAICTPITPLHVEEVSPIVWKPTRYYVSQGHTSFKFYYYVGSPCEALKQFQDGQHSITDTAIDTANRACNGIFEQLISHLQPKPKVTLHQVLDITRQEHIQHQSQLPQLNPLAPQQSTVLTAVNSIPQPPVMQILPQKQLKLPNMHQQHKRSISDTMVGIYLSDVWTTIRDTIWTNPQVQMVQDRQAAMEAKLATIQALQNITELTQSALSRAVEINANLIEANQAEISRVLSTHPALMVVVADIVCRTHKKIDLIDRIRASFKQKTPDLIAIAQLLEEDSELEDVDANSVLHKATKLTFHPKQNMFVMEFVARKRIKNAEVLRIEAFTIEANVTSENPTVLTYNGPSYVVHNIDYNCYQGINIPTELFVDVICEEQNYIDDSLSNWIQTTTGMNSTLRSQKIEDYPFVNIRCWNHKINIGQNMEECPPFPFRLPVKTTFVTSDGVKHSPSAVELSFNIKDLTYNNFALAEDANLKEKVHFTKSIKLFDAREAIALIHNLRKEAETAKQQSVALHISSTTQVTYRHLLTSLGSLCMLGAFVLVGMYVKRSRQQSRRHQELLRTVVDGFGGSGAYEVIKLEEKARSEKAKRRSIIKNMIDRKLSGSTPLHSLSASSTSS